MVDAQKVYIRFNQGVNTKSDPKQLQIGEMVSLENAVLTKEGAFSKRNGYVSLTQSYLDMLDNSGTISSALNVAEFNSELVEADSLNVYSYSNQESLWYKRGYAIATNLAATNVSQAFGQNDSNVPSSPWAAVDNNSVALYTWCSSSKFNFSLKDLNTGSSLFSSRDFSVSGGFAAISSQAVSKAAKFIVFTNNMTVISYSLIDPLIVNTDPSSTSLITGTKSSSFMDIVKTPDESTVYIAYQNSSNAPVISKIDISSGTPSVTSTVTLTGETSSSYLTIGYDSANSLVWIAYSNGSSVSVATFTPNLVASLAPTVVDNTSTNISKMGMTFKNNLCYLAYNIDFAATGINSGVNAEINVLKINTSGTKTEVAFVPNLVLLSKPIAVTSGADVNGIYVIGGFTGFANGQPNNFLVRIDEVYGGYTIAGRFAADAALSGNAYLSQRIYAAPLISIDASNYLFQYAAATNVFSVNGTIEANYTMYSLNAAFNVKRQKAVLGNSLFLTGGILSSYDSKSVTEANFLVFPEGITGTSTAGGGMTPAAQYQYSIVYEWVDAFGQLNQSAPSVPFTITLGGGDGTVNLVIPKLLLTNRGDFVSTAFNNGITVHIAVYRTLANGDTFFRVGSVKQTQNVISVYTQAFSDGNADSGIVGSSELYTTGGELENTAPFASNLITTFKNRVITVTSENPYQWNYSKQVIVNTPVEFTDNFNTSIDQKGGPIAAIAAMDDKLVFFKENAIFYVVGDGPAPNGTQNDFSYPQIIATDVGCIHPNSVTITPIGLMFQSHKGIYLLDRGLSTKYIGAPVEAYNSLEVMTAVLDEESTLVRFTLSSGISLVYDYFFNQWSTFTNYAAEDATIYHNEYTFVNASGKSFVQNTGFTDDGVAISMKAVTGWLNFAQVQGFQRVKQLLFLGDYKSLHNLTVQFAYDFDSTIAQSTVIPNLITVTPEQYRIFLARQKCQSTQVTIFDTPLAPLNEAVTLSSFMFEVGIKKGSWKTTAAQSYG